MIQKLSLKKAISVGQAEEILRKNRDTTDLQRQGFTKAVKAGVKIAYGTDAGVYPHGDNGKQFTYMVRYGMSPMQAIQSATTVAADLMQRAPDVGSVAPGHFADLIAVKGDPLKEIDLLSHVDHVMKGGVVIR